ncbi:MAG: HAD family phosphatase [Anaerolineae bacterium]
MQRAIIFDFGNVLMFTTDYTPRHAWDARLGLPPGSVERAVHNSTSWVQAQRGEIAITAYWQDVAERLSLSPEQTQQLAHDFYSGDTLDADMLAYIRELRATGHQTALLSNDSVELRPKLERLNLLSLFDAVMISAEVGVMKPDAAAYTAVLAAVGRPAPETVFVDDRMENVEGARAVGMLAVHYTKGTNLRHAITSLPEA